MAYRPKKSVAGFGSISNMIRAATQRLILQEEANRLIVDVIFEALKAKGVLAVMEFSHPCHRLPSKNSHSAIIRTQSSRGADTIVDDLRKLFSKKL